MQRAAAGTAQDRWQQRGRHGGIVRATTRVLALLLSAQVLGAALPAVQSVARADEMMLMNESRADSAGYGWLFVGLSAVAFAVAANGYDETQYNLRKARSAYSSYVAATTASDALLYRDLTNTYSHRAQAYESTTNAAFAIGVVLAATAIAIFRSDGKPDTPILLSDRGVEWTYRF